ELELTDRRQLVEEYRFFMFFLVRDPISIAPDKVVDYLLVENLYIAVLCFLLRIVKHFDTKAQHDSMVPVTFFYCRCLYDVTPCYVANVCHPDRHPCFLQ